MRAHLIAGCHTALLVTLSYAVTCGASDAANPQPGNCPAGQKYSVEIVQSATGSKWTRRTVPYPGSTSVKGHNHGFYIDNTQRNYDFCARASEGYVVDTDPSPGFNSGLKVGAQGADRYGRVYIDQPAPGCVHLYADDREGPSHVWVAEVYVKQKKMEAAVPCADAVRTTRELLCGLNQVQLDTARAIGPCAEDGLGIPTVTTTARLQRVPGGVEVVELSPSNSSETSDGKIKFVLAKSGLLNIGVGMTPPNPEVRMNALMWIGVVFTAIALLFFMGVYFRPPKTHGEYAVLRVIGSMLAGTAGLFLTGGITTEWVSDLPALGKITVSAGGAIGLYVFVWLTFPKPPEQGGTNTPSTSLSFPDNATFRQAAEAIAKWRRVTLDMQGFSAAEESVPLTSHNIQGVSVLEAFERLRNLVPAGSVRSYRVSGDAGRVQMSIEEK